MWSVILILYGVLYLVNALYALWFNRIFIIDIQKGGLLMWLGIFIPPYKCFQVSRGRHPIAYFMFLALYLAAGCALIWYNI